MSNEQQPMTRRQLIGDLASGRLSRRDFMMRAAALGLSASAIGAFLAACGGGGGTATTGTGASTGASTAPSAAPSTAASAAPSTGAAAAPTAATRAATASTAPGGVSTATSGAASTATRTSTATGGSATATRASGGAYQYTLQSPPPVPNAAQAKQYSGARLTYYADASGIGNQLDVALAQKFTQDTGIAVNVVGKPTSATETYSTYQRFFQAQSGDLDVMMIDVIWPAAFAPNLLDLTAKLGDQAKKAIPSIVQNNTVDGKLVGFPYFGDFGMLYYRKDLLQKYSVAVPKTWDELDAAAKKIVEGEKGSNPNLQGFIFQGNAYEGLTCNALEWIASSGGGTLLDGKNVTFNNPQAVAILNKAKGWVGTSAPKGVTSYQEDETAQAFTGGNAVFVRNWPYMYQLAQTADATKDKFDVAPLPVTGNNPPVGTLGGWQLGVSRFSKAPDAAIEFVRYMTSEEISKFRAVNGTYVPLYQSVSDDPDVQKNQPFLKNLSSVQRVVRPSNALGANYNQGSTIMFQAFNAILNGQDAQAQLQAAQGQLARLVR
ncbi:MAG TPA: ABC transporter substrate-binding protein [Thermomicrobiales bacterium]